MVVETVLLYKSNVGEVIPPQHKEVIMARYNILILIACIFLIGCPSNGVPPKPTPNPIVVDPIVVDPIVVDPIVVDPIVVDPIIIDPIVVGPNLVTQRCKIEWGVNGVSFDSYKILMNSVKEQLITSSCTADSILCILVGDGTPCQRVWEFKTMDDIPKKTITDECGNNVIYYLDQDPNAYP